MRLWWRLEYGTDDGDGDHDDMMMIVMIMVMLMMTATTTAQSAEYIYICILLLSYIHPSIHNMYILLLLFYKLYYSYISDYVEISLVASIALHHSAVGLANILDSSI